MSQWQVDAAGRLLTADYPEASRQYVSLHESVLMFREKVYFTYLTMTYIFLTTRNVIEL